MAPVRPEAGRPLYLTVKDTIRRAIDEGTYPAGARIPSTQQLSRQLHVSLVTAHRALQELVAGGVLNRTQGRGTFVNKLEGQGGGVRARSRVGLVLHRDSSIADYYHGRIFEGVRQAAHDQHVDLVLLRFGEDLRRECDGLLCVNPLPDEVDSVVTRASRDMPVVVVGATVASPTDGTVCCIDSDNHDLARQAVATFAELGHDRIGYVGGNDAISNSRDRWRGFEQGCLDDGREIELGNVLRVGGWRLNDEEKMELVAMLRSPGRPTAVFAAGYYFALDLYTAAAEAGLGIGQDLAVIGVDDPPSAAHLSPPLATLRQPLKEMGQTAVVTLQQLISGQPARSLTLRAELLRRASAGKA